MNNPLIQRSYRRRNRTVKLEEIGNWVAINDPADSDTHRLSAPISDEAPVKPRAQKGSPLPLRAAKTQARSLPPPADSIRSLVDEAAQVCFDTLEASGWRFEQRAEATQRAASQDQAKVYINEFGNIVLGTNQLTVKFPPETPIEAAKSMLARFGCTILKALPFGEEMYEIEIIDPTQGDSIDVASKLIASGLFEFAEPSLIETVSNR
jgi:hypothetical protein